MTTLSVCNTIASYKQFSREFWLSYKALEKVMDPILFDSVKTKLMKSKRIDPKLFDKIDKEAYEQARAEIDADWRQKSEDAKKTGTDVHDMIHNMLCTDLSGCKAYGIPTDQYKVEAMENFLQNDGIYPEFRMEVPLDDEYTLVGVADLIIKEGNKIKIIDFKTSDKIELKSKYDMAKKHSKKLSYPLSSLDDCNYNEYSLQLSIYAWQLKQINPDFEIVSLEIYHIQDMRLKKIYPVTELKELTEKLIKYHLKSVRLKRETEKCREIVYE